MKLAANKSKLTSTVISVDFSDTCFSSCYLTEGLDVSHVPMRPRGRPSRLFNEFALLQQERSVVNCSNSQSDDASKDNSEADVEPNGVDSSGLMESQDLANNFAVQDDQSLSLSVEIAAVNQAILSLTGQQPINIKSERTEKEPSKDESSS